MESNCNLILKSSFENTINKSNIQSIFLGIFLFIFALFSLNHLDCVHRLIAKYSHLNKAFRSNTLNKIKRNI